MPLDVEGMLVSSKTVEVRKLKIGKTGSRSPDKLKGMTITQSLKPSGGKNFERDYALLQTIFTNYGNKGETDGVLQRIPVRLFSDDVRDVVYIYRGWWARSGPRCMSGIGDENARRFFQQDKYEKTGEIVKLRRPIDFPCNNTCPMWGVDGEKTDCKWTAIVRLQLEDYPIFPSPTQFRTTGKQVIKTLVGSLNHIKEATGGILAGIPLELAWHEIEGGTRDGKKRKYPVLSFQFAGTLQQLREQAIVEMESRRRLKSAHAGKPVDVAIDPFVMKDINLPSEIVESTEESASGSDDDEYIPDDDDDLPAAAKSGDDRQQAKLKSLQETLDMSDKAVEMMLDKHGGDFAAAIKEMENMAPAGDFAPGEVNEDEFLPEEAEEEEEEKQEAAPEDVSDAELFGDDMIFGD
jgi:hypothetical protein